MQHDRGKPERRSGRQAEPPGWRIEVVAEATEEVRQAALREAMDIVAQWIHRTRPAMTASSPDR